jgi:hypothetical protein
LIVARFLLTIINVTFGYLTKASDKCSSSLLIPFSVIFITQRADITFVPNYSVSSFSGKPIIITTTGCSSSSYSYSNNSSNSSNSSYSYSSDISSSSLTTIIFSFRHRSSQSRRFSVAR